MSSDKGKQQRPPTPRSNPPITVSPTTSLLHQRRTNPKAGRSHHLLSQNLFTETSYSDPPFQQQHDEHPSLPEMFPTQPNPKTRETMPLRSLTSLSFSPTFSSPQWDSQDVSPLPHRSHSDTSDQVATEGHAADELESHIDVGSSSSSSAAPRVVRPVITGGKCSRPPHGGKLALIRPSGLSFVETAGSSDDRSSSSPQTPISRISPPLGSLSARKRTAYPGSSTSSSSSTTPPSVTLSSLSDEPRTEMGLLLRQYNIGIERQLRDIMNEKLPRLFKDCDALVRSMTKTPRLTSAASGHIHDFGRLPARDFKKRHIEPGLQSARITAEETPCQDTRDVGQSSVVFASKSSRDVDIQQPKPDEGRLNVIKEEEEEATQSDEPNVHDGRDQERTAPPTKAPVKQLSEESPPFATTPHDESDSKISPQQSDASRDPASRECSETGLKRKRDHGLTSERSESTSDNIPFLPESTHDDEPPAPGGEAFTRPGPGPVSQTQSLPRPLVDKKGPSSMPPHVSDMNPRATTIKANREEFMVCMDTFMDCCTQLQLYLLQPLQVASLVAFDSPPSRILTPTRHPSRSDMPGSATPLGIQHPSVQMKLKEEVQKAIKRGKDILVSIERYTFERAELLERIGGGERDGAKQDALAQWQGALAQWQEHLGIMDRRHSNQLRYDAMELQSSCATLCQMLQSVLG